MHHAQPIGLATQYNLCNKPWENFPLSKIMATLDPKLYDHRSPNTDSLHTDISNIKMHCVQVGIAVESRLWLYLCYMKASGLTIQ